MLYEVITLERRFDSLDEAIFPPESSPRDMASAREGIALAWVLHALGDYLCPAEGAAGLRDLAERWSLVPKAREILAPLEIEAAPVIRILDSMLAVSHLSDGKAPAKANMAKGLMLRLFTDAYAAKALGIHEWDGIEWFNKEAAELCVDCALHSMSASYNFV